ncbi:MAG: FtsQ-type POTRA domain-containing protein [Actinobacteria bacterium]|nr:FtsQ-type POTRA domain-containing protein [Actinomycetota bacterium]
MWRCVQNGSRATRGTRAVKRPERELLAKEKKRISRRARQEKPKSALGPFALFARVFSVAAPLVLISLVAATFFTPLLAIDKIIVSGTERLEPKKISKALESLDGRPLTTISEDEVAKLLSDFTLIETFAIQAEPPHTLNVKIRERQPIVALVRSGKNYLYDAAGVQIAQAEAAVKIPYLNLKGNPKDSPQFKTAIEVLLSLPVKTYQRVYSIEVSEQLTTKLVLKKSNITVIWGDTKQSLLKNEVLMTLLKTGLKESVVVDVSSPNAPVVTYPNY